MVKGRPGPVQEGKHRPSSLSRGWRVGSESCSHLVPESADLERLAKGREPEQMTLVTSLLEPPAFSRVLASALAALESGWGEVVVNDWGLLAALESRGKGGLTAGRLLMRFRRGPGSGDSWESLDEESRRYFAWGPLYDSPFLGHLRGLGVNRLEADPPRHWHPVPDVGELRISLHGNRRLITVAGSCPWLFEPTRGTWARPASCACPCVAGGTLMLHAGPLRDPLLLKGREILENAIEGWREEDLPGFVDRIVTDDEGSGTESAWRSRNHHENP